MYILLMCNEKKEKVFSARLLEMGRITIPESIRILNMLEKGDVVTVTIENVKHVKKLEVPA